jgi:hypothetical protein
MGCCGFGVVVHGNDTDLGAADAAAGVGLFDQLFSRSDVGVVSDKVAALGDRGDDRYFLRQATSGVCGSSPEPQPGRGARLRDGTTASDDRKVDSMATAS